MSDSPPSSPTPPPNPESDPTANSDSSSDESICNDPQSAPPTHTPAASDNIDGSPDMADVSGMANDNAGIEPSQANGLNSEPVNDANEVGDISDVGGADDVNDPADVLLGKKDDSSSAALPSQQIHHQTLSARVPEAIAPGEFATGVIVLTGRSEFVVDFVMRLGRPHRVAARVVLPPQAVPTVLGALRQSVERYEQAIGPLPELPRPPKQDINPNVIKDVYDEMKMSDDTMSGAYANGVMITSGQAEFCFDFFVNFFPTSSVSKRVHLAAAQVPRFVDALEQAWQQFQQRQG